MALHPEKQVKAQEEIDRVVGINVVRIRDKGKLPYVNALIQEVMRWNVVKPISLSIFSLMFGLDATADVLC